MQLARVQLALVLRGLRALRRARGRRLLREGVGEGRLLQGLQGRGRQLQGKMIAAARCDRQTEPRGVTGQRQPTVP